MNMGRRNPPFSVLHSCALQIEIDLDLGHLKFIQPHSPASDSALLCTQFACCPSQNSVVNFYKSQLQFPQLIECNVQKGSAL